MRRATALEEAGASNDGGKGGQRRRRRQAVAADEESRGGATLEPMASACEKRAESREERGVGERRAAAVERGKQRRQRKRARSSGVIRGVKGVGVRCRGKREATESRTTTMTVVADLSATDRSTEPSLSRSVAKSVMTDLATDRDIQIQLHFWRYVANQTTDSILAFD
ncbi:hypothetical protein Syun_013591 [Stephania yunnanensis]|uniref:Uncharacterized protein n=1 Tax=Stephania yunnanensis TaxID=152371 RepID=A0AAP0PB30_9MAGN